VEAADHAAGHCHTERDPETGIMKHVHGPHIFHSDNADVWNFVSRFAHFEPFAFTVNASLAGRLFALPINLATLSAFFERDFSPAQAQAYVAERAIRLDHEPRNFEEQALSTIGRELYEAFFKGYTEKHWGRPATDLPAAIFKRLPIRFTSDTNYFHHSRVGIPREGYTAMVERMLDHPRIAVTFSKKFRREDGRDFDHVFYTGRLDGYFDYAFGRLPYRSLRFEDFRVEGDFQPSATVNYPEMAKPYTRITEHKKFTPWEKFECSICSREYSVECGPEDVPYYPVNLAAGSELLDHYRREAAQLERVSFVGRLATFRYLDMDVAIAEALNACRIVVQRAAAGALAPTFFDP
jgi:UDP-galactopyranose mutase